MSRRIWLLTRHTENFVGADLVRVAIARVEQADVPGGFDHVGSPRHFARPRLPSNTGVLAQGVGLLANSFGDKDADDVPDVLADDLWALSRFSNELGEVCKKLGVKKLSEFPDSSSAAAGCGVEVNPLISESIELLTTLSAFSAAVGGGEGRLQIPGEDRRTDLESELQKAIRVTGGFQDRSKTVRVTVVS